MNQRLNTFVLALASALLAGCGQGSDPDAGDRSAAGRLLEVDGRIVATGETFELDPVAEGERFVFAYGPEVPRAAVQALAASGETARVSYRPTAEQPIATAVEPAPAFGEDVASYTGTIAELGDGAIVIDGPDGKRSFDISEADERAFDVPHLEDHKAEGSKVKVYYRADSVGLAYEDA